MSLFRSWMFVPGNHPRRLEKAKELQADVIIYDLEDAVPHQEKEKAREMAKAALWNNREKVQFVRVNDPSTDYFLDDLSAVAGRDLAGILLPKAASKEQILLADGLLTQWEKKLGLQNGALEIVPIIESALGLVHAYEIATVKGRVKRLAFGSVDYTLDIGAQLTKEGTELLFARSQLVVVSRAAGIEAPIDAVYIHLNDPAGLAQDAKLAKQLGFYGKLVIHPDQIQMVNDLFSPTEEELEEAKRITTAFDQALASGVAAIQVGGRMIDYPVAERAKRILGQRRGT